MAEYKSKYEDEIKAVRDEIANAKSFSYSPEADPLYRQYENKYRAEALAGMKNTLAEATGLTGGYNNSYAQIAAQKEYDRITGKLGDVIPELYQAAYNRYKDELADKYDRLGMLSGLDDAEYSRWRDSENEDLELYLKGEECALKRERAVKDNDLELELAYYNGDLRRELEYAGLDLEREKAARDFELEGERNAMLAEKYSADAANTAERNKIDRDNYMQNYLAKMFETRMKYAMDYKKYELDKQKNSRKRYY